MDKRYWAFWGALVVLAALCASPASCANVSLSGFTPAPSPGITVGTSPSFEADIAARIKFEKTGDERRLLALDAKAEGPLAESLSLAVVCRAQMVSGEAPRTAVLLYDNLGGVWYRVAGRPVPTERAEETRLSTTSLRKAAFSENPEDTLAWEDVTRVRIGFIFDGPARGIIEIKSARFTDEPFKQTQPLRITGDGPGKWSPSENEAVKSTLTTPNEGPEGQACLKYEFNAPGGGHRWMIPGTPVPAAELEGFSALRLKYKASLPKGIPGLLVMISERGGSQWYADPAPQPSEEWTEITIPFENFKFATWTKDASGKLEIPDAANVHVGAHGQPSGAGGPGLIMATDIEFVP